jgi:hypothetical protein
VAEKSVAGSKSVAAKEWLPAAAAEAVAKTNRTPYQQHKEHQMQHLK